MSEPNDPEATRPSISLPTVRRCETAYTVGPTGAPEVAHPDVGGRCYHCGEPPYNHAGPFDPPPPCDVLNGVRDVVPT
jgi:hypothetical protein